MTEATDARDASAEAHTGVKAEWEPRKALDRGAGIKTTKEDIHEGDRLHQIWAARPP